MTGRKATKDEILQFAIANGMIDTEFVQSQIEMQKRQEILSNHPYAIWQGKDGRWRTYLPPESEEGTRKLICKSNRESIENAIIEKQIEQELNPKLYDAFTEYADARLKNDQISEASTMRYEQEFRRCYKPWLERRIKTIEAEELCDFIEQRTAELKLTPKALANFKTITKGLFKKAYRQKLVRFRVMEEVMDVLDLSEKRLKRNCKDNSNEVYSEVEYEKYVEYLTDHSDLWNMALLIILVAGLRPGEVVALEENDLTDMGDYFTISVSKTETRFRKGNRHYDYVIKDSPKTEAGNRIVIVPKQFYWMYAKLKRIANGFVFISPKTGERITTNCLRRRQELNCIRLGMKQRSPHKGRKAYGSILLDNGVDANLILQQMGHADIGTTERFYHRNMKDAERKAEIISDIGIFDTV